MNRKKHCVKDPGDDMDALDEEVATIKKNDRTSSRNESGSKTSFKAIAMKSKPIKEDSSDCQSEEEECSFMSQSEDDSTNSDSSSQANADDIETSDDVNDLANQLNSLENEIDDHGMKNGMLEHSAKGLHIRSQLSLWEKALELRIRLQKILLLSNNLPKHQESSNVASHAPEGPIKALLTDIRHLLSDAFEFQQVRFLSNDEISKNANDYFTEHKGRKKRQFDESNTDQIWNHMQSVHKVLFHRSEQVLNQWGDRVQSELQLSTASKKFKSLNQNSWTQVENILGDRERLLRRAHTLRNQHHVVNDNESGANAATIGNVDFEMFDDTDFYQHLLRELIESRAYNLNDPVSLGREWLALRQSRTRSKNAVDLKSSKGRKIRYELQPKLLNFAAANPLSLRWNDDKITEFFSYLLGDKRIL